MRRTAPVPTHARQRVGWSVAKTAMVAGVHPTVIRAFEAQPAAIEPSTRSWLRELYVELDGAILPSTG